MSALRPTERPAIVVALAGQPNVGKSTIFNLLTGLSQHVGNWPGKTVERKEGTLVREGVQVRIVDLPGTYSLSANSEEERIARDFIIKEHPDVVVMVANAAALERNLYLLAELLILPVPVVLGLNMMDVAESEGIDIQPHVLAAALGLPVVPLVASRNQGVTELIAAAETLARTPEAFRPARPAIAAPHRDVLAQIRALLGTQAPSPYDGDWVALKLLEGDGEITALARTWLPAPVWQSITTLLAQHEDAVLDIAGGRYEWIARMVRAAVTRPRLGQISFTDRLDRIALHPLWGLLLLFAAFGLTFWLTFTLAAPVQAWLETGVVAPVQRWLHAVLAGAPAWLVDLLAEGVLGGAGIVITFVPILAVFFTVLALLEGSGYLARAAYLMDRFMHALGLHGKSFLPLFLGFGCNVPAVMGARVIESPGGRLLTILLAPLVPCSARLAVLAFLTPVFFGHQAFAFALGLVALNLLVLALVGVLLNRTLFRGQHAAFIMELPLYHVPNARSIGLFVWHNIGAFLRRAGTLILLVAVVIWALASFPGSAIETSYLARFGQWLAPLGQLMGMDWRLLVALLSSFIAKENAIATLGILYGSEESAQGLAAALAAAVSPATGLAFLTVTMLFIPCVATVAVMRQETQSWRWTLFSVLLLLTIALAAGVAVYHGAHWLGFGAVYA
ncbi:MAG: ferrous iron transport protein B [Candidatus Muproteobacteria bacterium RBG_16_64_11]|uniref:Ferrous iron transport protein B n=1 Tax=Candidatus Muproteobacteria bacterium RBG_16_64_11 TaxID=1817758 RepID=A0A1F6TFZ6_9PROT|nr:MAG: ferrous iron transport protein B [Candidatus Muproteobacteria bacterium RBG_16_64_11]